MKNSKSAQMLRQADRTSPLPGTDTDIVYKRIPVEYFFVHSKIRCIEEHFATSSTRRHISVPFFPMNAADDGPNKYLEFIQYVSRL